MTTIIMKKRLFAKLALVYLVIFVLYFTIVSLLGMYDGHGFFWITPAKLTFRILVPFMLVAELYFGSLSLPVPGLRARVRCSGS